MLQPGLTYPGGSGWEFAVVGVLLVLSLRGLLIHVCTWCQTILAVCTFNGFSERGSGGKTRLSSLRGVLSLSLSHIRLWKTDTHLQRSFAGFPFFIELPPPWPAKKAVVMKSLITGHYESPCLASSQAARQSALFPHKPRSRCTSPPELPPVTRVKSPEGTHISDETSEISQQHPVRKK